MRQAILRQIGEAPITLPCAATVILMLVWAQADGGQPLTTWSPGLLLVLGLLALALLSVAGGWSRAPGPVRGAALALGAFTAWSFASIGWAGDRGAAWEGANRTLLYLAIFCLFALWAQRPRSASALLSMWTLGMIVLAIAALLRIPGAGDPATLFVDDRLDEPAGYPNAAACMWLMAVWPAISLAASDRLHWALRGALAGGAVVLIDLALLSLSRGALFAFPIAAVVFFACFGDRLRRFAVALPVAVAAAVAAPVVLDVGPAITGAGDPAGQINAMVRAVLLGALVVAALVCVMAAQETTRRHTRFFVDSVRRVTVAVAVLAIVAIASVAVVKTGNPVDRADSAWSSFKGGYAEEDDGSRLLSGLGSNRYDFYRVALDVFEDQPLKGSGADNFFADYLRRGRSNETPRYPHSVELRTAAQTGLVGLVLLGGFLLLAIRALLPLMRRGDPLAVAVATGAAMVFAYWFVHGSADWFWEYAGLGAPAFAFLGLACALIPRPAGDDPPVWAKAVAVVAVAVGVVSVALPWMAERDVRQAASVYDARPFEAYDRLDRAARLNPLSDRPDLVAGSIALRYGDTTRADDYFASALGRVKDGEYATLLRGAIASQRGDPRALALLNRAAALAPRDELARESRDIVAQGDRVDVNNLARAILVRATRLGGG